LGNLALHQPVVRVEKAVGRQEIALGVFLDIEGAFDDKSNDSTCSALTRHGVDQSVVRWIRATLEGRLATADFGGVSMGVAVPRDCPRREGVMTPLMVPSCE